MELSVVLMRLLGVMYLIMALGLLMNQKAYKKIFADFYKHTPLVFMMAFMSIIMGMLLVSYHNIWEWSVVGLVTLVGWSALIKGAALVVFPDAFREWTGRMLSGPWYPLALAVTFIVGLFMTYHGFFA